MCILKIIVLFNFFIIFFFSIIDVYKYNITFNEYLQRYSIYNYKLKKYDYLIYGASCGEILASIPIVNLLPKKNIVVSCHTLTGYRLIKNKLKNTECVLKPYENIFTLFYFLYKINPRKIIIIESDVWPLFTCIAKLLNIHLLSINYKFKKEKPFRNSYHYYLLDKMYLKEPIHFYNNKYEFLGNIKLLKYTNKQLVVKKKRLLVIVSAHQDELEIHYEIIKFCLENNIKVVYIPRYLNYEKKLQEKFKTLNYYWLTDKNNNLPTLIDNNDLIVCFCYGLTNCFLSYSKLSIMGGTFNQIGGHNIVEPISNYNYLIMGPNYKTCNDLYIILNKYGIISICNTYKKITNEILYFINCNMINIINTLFYLDEYRNNLNDRVKSVLISL